MNDMSSVLITGASGYLGSSFIGEYGEQYGVERFSLRYQSLKNIDFQRFDRILHCAGIVHRGENVSADEYFRVNVAYPLELAKLSKANGVRHFLFISSVSVYGPIEYIDDNSVCNPVTKYGKSKLEAEQRLLDLHDERFTVTVLRVPMIYGPLAPGNIQSIIKILKFSPLIPLGNISNRRSFISIRNLTYAMDRILKYPKGGVFLLADDMTISTSNLVSILIESANYKRFLLDSNVVRLACKIIAPAVYAKLWGNLIINSRLSKEILNLDFPIDVSDGLAEVFQAKVDK